MTTHRKGFVQYCKKPRTFSTMPAASLPRPLARRLRTRCGRRGGRNRVRENVVSGERDLVTLGRDAQKSRQQNLVFGTGYRHRAVSSALIRGFPVKSAASSAASVSSRPSSSSSSCPASAVCSSSSSPPSTCEFAILARISTSATTSILTFRSKLTVSAGRPVTGSISALSTGALLRARDRAEREFRSSQAYNTKSSRQTSADSPMLKQSEDFLCPSFAM